MRRLNAWCCLAIKDLFRPRWFSGEVISFPLFFLVEVTTARLNRLAKMLEAGELRTTIASVLPLHEAIAAHEMLDGTRGRGKIVLRIDEPTKRRHAADEAPST